jgi:intein-encoded DNA endonuclease-like protein
MESLKSLKDVQNWIKDVYKDPLTKTLLEKSNLTKIQLETFLIDIITDYLTDKNIRIEDKAKIRIKGKISKGAFNRTLNQARKNIVSSICTLMLLGYLGLIDLTTIKKYIEASEKLKEYVEALKSQEKAAFIEENRKELEEIFSEILKHEKIKYL